VSKRREKGTGEAETFRHYLGLVDAKASSDRVMQRLRATLSHSEEHQHQWRCRKRHPAKNASASAV